MATTKLPEIFLALSRAYPSKARPGAYERFFSGTVVKDRTATKDTIRSEISERFGVHPKSILTRRELLLLLFCLIIFGKRSVRENPDVYKPFIRRER